MRHLVTFQERMDVQDAGGEMVPTWVDAFPQGLSTEITPLYGKDLIAAQAEQSEITTRLKVRYRPGFTPTMRGLHRGIIYDIKFVIADPDSGYEFVTLMCGSGLNQG